MITAMTAALAAVPATGNVESKTYIFVLIGAGVILAIAGIAGALGKKKKK